MFLAISLAPTAPRGRCRQPALANACANRNVPSSVLKNSVLILCIVCYRNGNSDRYSSKGNFFTSHCSHGRFPRKARTRNTPASASAIYVYRRKALPLSQRAHNTRKYSSLYTLAASSISCILAVKRCINDLFTFCILGVMCFKDGS